MPLTERLVVVHSSPTAQEAHMASGRKRTTHRSISGTKLYAVRDAKGRFVDIQTYKRAHAADMRMTSKDEAKAKKK
jgi:hypothetical protein